MEEAAPDEFYAIYPPDPPAPSPTITKSSESINLHPTSNNNLYWTQALLRELRDFVLPERLSILKNSAQEPCDHPPDLLVLTRVCQWSYGKELHYDSEIVSATALAAPQAFPQAPAETFGEP